MAGWCLSALILLSVAHGLVPRIPQVWAGVSGWLAGLLLFPRVRGVARIQVAAMLALGLAGLAWAAAAGRPVDWAKILDSNQALLAMLASVSFLRLTATAEGDDRGNALSRGPRALVQTLLGVHLLGAVINLSAVAILGDRMATGGMLSPLQGQVLSRGFALAANWSPFFAAMGLALANAPGASLWVLVTVGIPVAALALAFSVLELGPRARLQGFVGNPMHLKALALPGTLAVAVMTIHGALPAVPILTLVSALSVSATLVVLARREGCAGPVRAARFVTLGLPGMANELALFLAAGVLSVGIGAAVGASGLALALAGFGAWEATGLLVLLVTLAILGVHPVVGISVAAGVLTPLRPDPNLLALAFLMTWALGVTLSPFSGLSLALQGRYGVDSHRFPIWGWRFAVFVLAVDSAALHLYGHIAGIGD
jgi:hypothetical protein